MLEKGHSVIMSKDKEKKYDSTTISGRNIYIGSKDLNKYPYKLLNKQNKYDGQVNGQTDK